MAGLDTDDAPTREALEILLGERVVEAVRLGPWSVMRCQLADGPRSVIVKWRRTGSMRTDQGRIAVEHAALAFLTEVGFAKAPRLLASDLKAGLLVLEDLAPRRALDLQLREAGVDGAWEGLVAFVHTAGELAAHTAGRAPAFEALRVRDSVLPSPQTPSAVHASLATLRRLGALGLTAGIKVEADLAAAFASMVEPGPFLAFSNGDCEANNVLTNGSDGWLIDFEDAQFRHALADAAAIHVPGPAWLTVAGAAERARLEAVYRRALATGVKAAEDDAAFGLGMAAACLTRACERLTRFERLETRPLDDASRVQMVSTLEAAAGVADSHRRLPHLAGWTRAAAAWLRRRWPDADVDLGALGAYAPRAP
jgi:hypothetical protein